MDPSQKARQGAQTVGILSSFLDDPHSIQIARSAAQRLTREGFHAVTFTSGFPSAPMFGLAQGLLAIPPALRGLIVLSASLREFNQELIALLEHSATPVVSIGAELPRATNITTDDETGVFQAIVHLVKQHGCRRIAFISAPESSVDGARRFSAYRSALESLKVRFDPALVVRGDYEASSGREAVLNLRRLGRFDAVVAANDLMAIGAMEALHAAKLRVPEDVKVVGFDDAEEAGFTSPALTTVRQPAAEQGTIAADRMIQLLEGASPAEDESISAPLVIRKSCGCGNSEPPRRGRDGRSEPPGAESDRELVNDALRGLIRRQMAARRLSRELSRVAEEVIHVTALPDLAQTMTSVFRLLNARRLLLCRYSAGMSHARVMLESTERDVVFRGESRAFPMGGLVPEGFLKPRHPAHIWIETLQLAREHVGYLVLEMGAGDYQPLLELRHALSSALGRIELIGELRRLYAGERKSG